MRKINLTEINPVWVKLASFLGILFFVLLSDAILSDWVPGYLQGILGSPLKMGLVMAFSSVIGIAVDLIFPQLLRAATVKQLAIGAVGGSAVFIMALYYSTYAPYLLVLLTAMAAWGIYYEFDGFMSQQYVAEQAPSHMRSSMWAVVEVFRAAAYFTGPIIGGYIAEGGNRQVLVTAGGMLLVGYMLLLTLRLPRHSEETPLEKINIAAELTHWVTLIKHIWPVLAMSLLVGLIDASFWTTGTVVTDSLAEKSRVGGFFLSLYMLPSLFVGFAVARWGLYTGKKKWAERFLLAAGILLAFIKLIDSVWWILAIVFISSVCVWVAIPLIDATYTDVVTRMGRERKHLFGLSSSMFSFAYIVGPIISGWLVTVTSEMGSFAYLGVIVALGSLILLVTTPRKMRLPQQEISSWE